MAFGREKDGCNKRYAHWRYIGCSTVHRSVFPGDGDALLRLSFGAGRIHCLSLIHIYGEVWHLDVGSSHPGAEFGPKGLAVRQLKRYASWVQNVVRQFGPYLSWAQDI